MQGEFIPQRFFNLVVVHLANALHSVDLGSSQAMLIHGEPGTGKTLNLIRSLERLQANPVYVDSRSVESHSANRPIEWLHAAADTVKNEIAHGRISALIIDDVDLLLGRFDDVQYTHNLQRLLAQLMHLATGTTVDGRLRSACPLFLLANDVSVIHSPLLRLGRAKVVHWEMSIDERFQVLQELFPDWDEPEARDVFRVFERETPAFFGRLHEAMMEQYLEYRLHAAGPDEVLREALQVHNRRVLPVKLALQPAEAIKLGQRIVLERKEFDKASRGAPVANRSSRASSTRGRRL